jgi:hypothetical protein
VRPAEGPANQSRIDNVSANVVSVLQGGAFFGALSSAPISGGSCIYLQLFGLHHGLLSPCKGLPRIVPSMDTSKFPTNNDCFSYLLRLRPTKIWRTFPLGSFVNVPSIPRSRIELILSFLSLDWTTQDTPCVHANFRRRRCAPLRLHLPCAFSDMR